MLVQVVGRVAEQLGLEGARVVQVGALVDRAHLHHLLQPVVLQAGHGVAVLVALGRVFRPWETTLSRSVRRVVAYSLKSACEPLMASPIAREWVARSPASFPRSAGSQLASMKVRRVWSDWPWVPSTAPIARAPLGVLADSRAMSCCSDASVAANPRDIASNFFSGFSIRPLSVWSRFTELVISLLERSAPRSL